MSPLYRKLILGVLIVLPIGYLYATASSHFGKSAEPGDVRTTDAPDISIRAPGGDVSLASQRGKVVLLDFWATWCGPCRMSIPAVEAIYKEKQARGFEVLGVSVDNDPSGIPDFVKEMGMTYPVGLPASMESVRQYAAGSIPLMVLVDRKGKIRWVQEGYGEGIDEILSKKVDELLSESG